MKYFILIVIYSWESSSILFSQPLLLSCFVHWIFGSSKILLEGSLPYNSKKQINPTFRLLVGLRWWSEIKDDGSEEWLFESKDQNYSPNSVDSAFFWTAQLAGSGVWIFFLVLNILSFTPYWV